MIARLRGLVDQLLDGAAVIDVGGVGYLVFCSRRTLDRLGGIGEATALHVDTHVREDHIHLYGFHDTAERAWFRLLITVQGVGPRHALSLLSVVSPEQLTVAIAAQDRAILTRADGVGPKLAQRICTELKDKVAGIALGAAASMPTDGGRAVAPAVGDGPAGDAVSALVNLGYGRSEAFAAVTRAQSAQGQAATVESLIPAALKELLR